MPTAKVRESHITKLHNGWQAHDNANQRQRIAPHKNIDMQSPSCFEQGKQIP